MKTENLNNLETKTGDNEAKSSVDCRVIKKPAGVLPSAILGNQDNRKHRYWSNLLRITYTYTSCRFEDSFSSYQNQFLKLLRLWNQPNCRWLLNHHLHPDVSRRNKQCISFYKIFNKLENNINHIKPFEAALRFEFTPKSYSFFCFYVKQVFHNLSFIYYKYNKYNSQSQVVNKLALS